MRDFEVNVELVDERFEFHSSTMEKAIEVAKKAAVALPMKTVRVYHRDDGMSWSPLKLIADKRGKVRRVDEGSGYFPKGMAL